jgi:hypothetical protein
MDILVRSIQDSRFPLNQDDRKVLLFYFMPSLGSNSKNENDTNLENLVCVLSMLRQINNWHQRASNRNQSFRHCQAIDNRQRAVVLKTLLPPWPGHSFNK